MEKICQHSQSFMQGLLTKDEYLMLVAHAVMQLDYNQATALAIIMHGEEEEGEDG